MARIAGYDVPVGPIIRSPFTTATRLALAFWHRLQRRLGCAPKTYSLARCSSPIFIGHGSGAGFKGPTWRQMQPTGYPLDSPDPRLLCRPLFGFCAAD